MTDEDKIHVATTDEVLSIMELVSGALRGLKSPRNHPLLMWAACMAVADLLWSEKSDQYNEESLQTAEELRAELVVMIKREIGQ